MVEAPSVAQLSQVITQVTAPAFLLGAVASFTSVLIARMNRIIGFAVYNFHKIAPGNRPSNCLVGVHEFALIMVEGDHEKSAVVGQYFCPDRTSDRAVYNCSGWKCAWKLRTNAKG